MIYELREYRMTISTSSTFLANFRDGLMPMLTRAGFDVVGAWVTNIGPGAYSDLVWLIRWENLQDRQTALDKLHALDGFEEHGQANRTFVEGATVRILLPTDFSDLR